MTVTVPGPTLGVVGGGQLGRMLAEAAAPLGVDVVVLDPTPDCPAASVAREQIEGAFDDPDAVRALADRADALTIEIELADPELLAAVEGPELPVHPAPETLRTIRDKLVQKRALDEAGVPVPPFRAVDSAADLRDAVEEFGSVMLKARTGGYDGRGNVPVESAAEAEDAFDAVEGAAMAEAFVEFERELSVIGVAGREEVRTFPAGENVHEAEILRETVVPARTDDAVADRADAVARDVLDLLDGRGVYGIELFETDAAQSAADTSSGRSPRDGDNEERSSSGSRKSATSGDGEILVNEIAPRPHNSGHWSIEGARASQFEQHVRAVLGWPLAPAEARAPTISANVLGTVEESRPARLDVEPALATDDAHLHWYGKREVRPLRKMGHLTLVGDGVDAADRDELLARARTLRDELAFADDDEADAPEEAAR